MSFLDGFRVGMEAYERGRKRAMEDELAQVAQATETTDTGFTAEQGEQLHAAANSGQYDVAWDGERGQYTVRAKADPAAQADVAPGTRHNFLGVSSSTPLGEEEKGRARLQAQAGVMEKFSDFEGANRIRGQAQQRELTGLQLAETKKAAQRGDIEWSRKQKALDDEDAYKSEVDGLFKNSAFGRKAAAFNEQMASFRKAHEEYTRRRDAGDTSAVAPAEPKPPMLTMGETMLDGAQVLYAKARHGKAGPEDLMSYGQKMQQLQQEGMIKVLRLAQSGAPLTQVVEAFNANGDHKIDPKAIVEDRLVDRGNGMKSRLITSRRPDGTTTTIDTLSELDAFKQAGDLFERAFKAADDRRGDKQLALQGQQVAFAGRRDAREQAEFEAGSADRQLKGAVSKLQLDVVGDDPAAASAAQAKLAAVGKGVSAGDRNEPAEVKLANAMLRAGMAKDMKSALEMAITKKGQAADDVHREFVAAGVKNMLKPAEAVKQADEVMASMGYARSGGRWAMPSEQAPPAMPKSEADAQAQARDAVTQGAPKDEVNRRLKAAGFKPI